MSTPLPCSSLSIVLPCRNEAGNVERVVAAALRAGKPVTDRLEVIVVDDGSTDNTAALADVAARSEAAVRVVRNERSLGYGGALKRGFAAATGDWVFFTDGDGQFDLAQLPTVMALIGPDRVVAAFRIHRRDPPLRRLMGRGWTWLVNIVFGLRVRDVDCAFKVFPREFLRSIELRSGGALISAELLARASYRGLKIVQVGVHHQARTAGRSSGGSPRVILRAVAELLSLRGQIRREAGAGAPRP